MIEVVYQGEGHVQIISASSEICYDMSQSTIHSNPAATDVGAGSDSHATRIALEGQTLITCTHPNQGFESIGPIDVLMPGVDRDDDISVLLECIASLKPQWILPWGRHEELSLERGTALATRIMQQGIATPKVLRPGQLLVLK